MSSICKFLLDSKYATVITKIYVNLTLENYGVILSEYQHNNYCKNEKFP